MNVLSMIFRSRKMNASLDVEKLCTFCTSNVSVMCSNTGFQGISSSNVFLQDSLSVLTTNLFFAFSPAIIALLFFVINHFVCYLFKYCKNIQIATCVWCIAVPGTIRSIWNAYPLPGGIQFCHPSDLFPSSKRPICRPSGACTNLLIKEKILPSLFLKCISLMLARNAKNSIILI